MVRRADGEYAFSRTTPETKLYTPDFLRAPTFDDVSECIDLVSTSDDDADDESADDSSDGEPPLKRRRRGRDWWDELEASSETTDEEDYEFGVEEDSWEPVHGGIGDTCICRDVCVYACVCVHVSV